MAQVHTVGFEEFLEEKVTGLVELLPWMKEASMKLCSGIEELREFISKAIGQGRCGLDLETTGLNTRQDKDGKPTDRLVGISLALDRNTGIYVPVNHKEGEELNLKEELVLLEIKRLCNSCVIIVHHAKYDLQMLRNYGIVVDCLHFDDTLILAKLYDAGQKEIGLKPLSEKILKRPMITFEKITGGSKRFDMVSPRIGYVYAVSDAVNTYGLYEFFIQQQIIADQMSVYGMERRLVLVVMQIEANLIRIDKPYLEQEKMRLTARMREIEQEVFNLARREFNLASTQQLGKMLFEELGFDYPEKAKTASGQYMTETSTLEKIADRYPIVKKIVEYRETEKVLGTYVEKILANCDENDCIKLSFNQSGTDTGRFSSPGGQGLHMDGYAGVNVQSIPKDKDGPTDMRKAFIPRPGRKLVAMDYSNEELRVATNLSREQKWIDEFLKGSDLHRATAKLIFRKDDPTETDRRTAKCVAKGTLIASERGWIPIENLKENDMVVSHTGELKRVTKIWDMGVKSGVAITTQAGHRLTCGLNHRFLSEENNWIKAENLQIGQSIWSWAGTSCTNFLEDFPELFRHPGFWKTEVKSLNFLDAVHLMDLTVEDSHTYVAQGLVTHNTANFLVMYGGGSRGLAQKAKIPEPEAKRILDSFFGALPTLTKWINSERARARKTKMARTVFGRVRPLQMFYDSGDKGMEAHADRCAVNFLIQGGCADIMKTIMVRVWDWIMSNNLQDEIRILITMHDELVFEMPEDKLDVYIPKLNSIMAFRDALQGMLKWPVPLTVEAKYGDSWRATNNFFKEHPELEKVEEIKFNTKIAEPPAEPKKEETVSEIPADLQVLPMEGGGKTEEPAVAPAEAEPDEFIYKVKDLKPITLRRLNDVLTFLSDEDKKKDYSNPVKILKIRDRDGNTLSVSNMKVRSENFTILARYVGL